MTPWQFLSLHRGHAMPTSKSLASSLMKCHGGSARLSSPLRLCRSTQTQRSSALVCFRQERQYSRAKALHASRRDLTLFSQVAPLAALNLELDPTTLLNSLLGAFGLPKLKQSTSVRRYEDVENGILLEYPAAWVKRSNTLRPGVYFSNFDSGDRAVLEIFRESDADSLEQQLVAHFVNPAAEIGGDSRLMSPPSSRIKSSVSEVDGQSYAYVDFPTETITRSGYQIKQKNFGVAAKKKGKVFTLVSSARSDQYNKDKEQLLRRIVGSFRLAR